MLTDKKIRKCCCEQRGAVRSLYPSWMGAALMLFMILAHLTAAAYFFVGFGLIAATLATAGFLPALIPFMAAFMPFFMGNLLLSRAIKPANV